MRVKVGTEVLEKDSLKSHLGATYREKRDNLCDRVMRGHITRYQRNAEIKGYDWQNSNLDNITIVKNLTQNVSLLHLRTFQIKLLLDGVCEISFQKLKFIID